MRCIHFFWKRWELEYENTTKNLPFKAELWAAAYRKPITFMQSWKLWRITSPLVAPNDQIPNHHDYLNRCTPALYLINSTILIACCNPHQAHFSPRNQTTTLTITYKAAMASSSFVCLLAAEAVLLTATQASASAPWDQKLMRMRVFWHDVASSNRTVMTNYKNNLLKCF